MPGDRGPRRRRVALCLLLFAGALALYLRTLAPSVLWGDGSELQHSALTGAIPHPTGYPTWVLCGRLFAAVPFGELPWRVNLMSAVLGAGAVATLFLLLARSGVRESAALAVACAFAVSGVFWSQAVVAEVYSLNVLWLGITALLVASWRPGGAARHLLLLALCAALGAGNHASYTTLLPLFAAQLVLADPRIVRRWPLLLGCVLAFAVLVVAVYFSPLWHSPLYARFGLADLLRPEPWQRTWAHATGAQFDSAMYGFRWSAQPAKAAEFLGAVARELTPLGLGLSALGLLAIRRVLVFVPVCLLANALLFVQMDFADVTVMLLPAYFMAAVLAGLGLESVLARSVRLARGPRLALAALLLAAPPLFLLARNFAAVDRSGDRRAEDWARGALAAVAPDALVLAPWSHYWPLVVLQTTAGLRSDVEPRLGSEHAIEVWARAEERAPLYFGGPLPELERLVVLEPRGPVAEVVGVVGEAR